MVFSSTTFLFLFLPAVWGLYTFVPRRLLKLKNFILAAASLVFYAFGEPVYVAVMLFSAVLNYALAIAVSRAKRKKALLSAAVIADILILFTFKYVPWLVSVVNSAAGIAIPVPAELKLPIGISFYTFQILSYVIDVYREKCPAQRNFLDLLLYISFFPQLIAGPIVKYGDIADQIRDRTVSVEKTAVGIRRFIIGLSKKVLISNSAAIMADAAFAASAPSSLFAWLGAVCYGIQLYYDFSGYSDMAIGLAGMFGFSLNENFNYPYAATSIRDFWKRWHISLTSWFREYVYIPLGGNRRGKARTVFNRIVIFFLTGIWHGANFTYILWGMWHGLLMLFEELVGFHRLEAKRALRPLTRLWTLLAVCIGFVMFRASGVVEGFRYLGAMFSFSGASHAFDFLTPWALLMIVVGVVFSAPLLRYLKTLSEKHFPVLGEAFSYVICASLLVLSVMSLTSSAFNPFIYYIF